MLKKSLPSIFDRQQKPSSERAEEPFRPLKPAEANLIQHLLERGKRTQKFLAQLSSLQARRSCTCGCPTIALHVAEDAAKVQSSTRIIVDDVFGYSEGKLVGLILFADDGKLSELEIYDVAGQFTGEFGLPEIDTLTSDFSAPMTQPSAE